MPQGLKPTKDLPPSPAKFGLTVQPHPGMPEYWQQLGDHVDSMWSTAKNMPALNDTQYHLNEDPLYQGVLAQARTFGIKGNIPAQLTRAAGVSAPTKMFQEKEGGSIYFMPPGTKEAGSESTQIEAADSPYSTQPGVQGTVPEDAGIRARTFKDHLQEWRDAVGRKIAPMLGLDFDQMSEAEAHGMRIAMIPFGPPSSYGKTLLETELKHPLTAKMITPSLIDPEKFVAKDASLFIDPKGHVIDLNGAIHSQALIKLEPQTYADILAASPQDVASGKASPFAEVMKKTKFLRVGTSSTGTINAEMHTTPTPEQIDSLIQLFETPKARNIDSHYVDIFKDGKNKFGAGAGPDIIDKILELYEDAKLPARATQ